jgi:hypothetical protein
LGLSAPKSEPASAAEGQAFAERATSAADGHAGRLCARAHLQRLLLRLRVGELARAPSSRHGKLVQNLLHVLLGLGQIRSLLVRAQLGLFRLLPKGGGGLLLRSERAVQRRVRVRRLGQLRRQRHVLGLHRRQRVSHLLRLLLLRILLLQRLRQLGLRLLQLGRDGGQLRAREASGRHELAGCTRDELFCRGRQRRRESSALVLTCVVVALSFLESTVFSLLASISDFAASCCVFLRCSCRDAILRAGEG